MVNPWVQFPFSLFCLFSFVIARAKLVAIHWFTTSDPQSLYIFLTTRLTILLNIYSVGLYLNLSIWNFFLHLFSFYFRMVFLGLPVRFPIQAKLRSVESIMMARPISLFLCTMEMARLRGKMDKLLIPQFRCGFITDGIRFCWAGRGWMPYPRNSFWIMRNCI